MYTDLPTVKSWCKVATATTSDDDLLNNLIKTASAYIDTYCGRTFLTNTYTVTLNGRNESGIAPKNSPITAVSSITIDNVPIQASTTQQMFGYTFDDKFIYLRGYRFCSGIQNVTITYTAGYTDLTTLPMDLQRACVELVGFKYRAKEHIGQVAQSTDRIVTNSYLQKDVPLEVQTTLDRYRRVTI